jgi:hypothetical protein
LFPQSVHLEAAFILLIISRASNRRLAALALLASRNVSIYKFNYN